MNVNTVPKLHVLSSQHLAHKLDVDKTVICSPHELIAIVTDSNDVVVYRLNGQIAITLRHPDADPYDDDPTSRAAVTCVKWSPDGRSLAVAWSDGTWNIHESEKGEVVLKGNVSDDDSSPVHVIQFDWRHYQTPNAASAESVADDHSGSADADLPRAVTLLDITTILPKLSSLPSHGLRAAADGTTFANQAATDSIFDSNTQSYTDGQVEILSVHTSDGRILIFMDGASHIGTVRVTPTSDRGHVIGFASTSSLATFSHDVDSAVNCSVLELPLSELDSAAFHVIAHNAAQLSALLQYLQRTTQCIAHDFSTGNAYPSRLLKNISMTLEDQADTTATLTSALLHLAMAGQFHPDVQEWLVDIVKETGLKRWDASISGMYSAIQTHLHQHMLPALDRIVVSASRIRGFARLHQGSTAFTPEEQLFDAILQASDTLRTRVNAVLDMCISEWSIWRAFARWLKMQIEIATAIPGTKSAAEAEERECVNIDISKTIRYVQEVLGPGSALTTPIATAQQATSELSLPALVASLQETVQQALQAITFWQGRLFRKPNIVQLQLRAPGRIREIACFGRAEQRHQPELFFAVLGGSGPTSLELLSVTAASLARSTSAQLGSIDVSLNVVDACFFPHTDKVLVLRTKDPDRSEHDEVSYELVELDINSKRSTLVHTFDNQVFKHILVGGRPGKEFCVVFSQGDTAWQVLDLHATADPA